MLKKIFIGLFSLATIVAAFLTYYSYDWLQSIGNPEIAVQNFQYFSSINWTYIWISFIVLLICANVIIWKSKNVLFVWLSYAYFIIFIALHTFWLERNYLSFLKSNGLAETAISVTPLIGVVICIIVAIAVFFNQFILLRLREKLIGDAENAELPEQPDLEIKE